MEEDRLWTLKCIEEVIHVFLHFTVRILTELLLSVFVLPLFMHFTILSEPYGKYSHLLDFYVLTGSE